MYIQGIIAWITALFSFKDGNYIGPSFCARCGITLYKGQEVTNTILLPKGRPLK